MSYSSAIFGGGTGASGFNAASMQPKTFAPGSRPGFDPEDHWYFLGDRQKKVYADRHGAPAGYNGGSAGGGGANKGGTSGAGANSGYNFNVNTGTQPIGDIFSPDYTQRATTQAREQALTLASPRAAMKQFTRPGMSQDAGTYAAALPQIAGGEAAAAAASSEIPMQHRLANELYRLTNQELESQQALSLADMMRQRQADQDYYGDTMRAIDLQLLGPILGMI